MSEGDKNPLGGASGLLAHPPADTMAQRRRAGPRLAGTARSLTVESHCGVSLRDLTVPARARRTSSSHQPLPELPELDDFDFFLRLLLLMLLLAWSFLPVGVAAHHRPPEASRPLPLTCPDAVSPA
jgi:hypothetical protein